MKAFVFASLDCVAIISQGREPRVYIPALHVHSSNVCYLFLGLHGRLLKGKAKGFKWGGGRRE